MEVKVDLRYTWDMSRGDERLRSLLNRAQDLRPVFREIARSFNEFQDDLFASSGAAAGGWAPLAPSTLAQKAAQGYPSDILVRTGRMRRSLVSKTSDSVEEITAKYLLIGTSRPYARFHQTGTVRMPARPIIVVPESLRENWLGILARHLEAAI